MCVCVCACVRVVWASVHGTLAGEVLLCRDRVVCMGTPCAFLTLHIVGGMGAKGITWLHVAYHCMYYHYVKVKLGAQRAEQRA